ncbi:MAG TPA: hypothetical protein VF278_11455 [Pirellulales bacterium]
MNQLLHRIAEIPLEKQTTSENGHDRLDQALAALAQNMANLSQSQATLTQTQANLTQTQATLAQNQVAFLGRMAENERSSAERFARIEQDITAIMRVLTEHSRLLERLPEAVRDKIGFRGGPGSDN